MNSEKKLRRGILLSLISACLLTFTAAYLFVNGQNVSRILFIWGGAKLILALILYLLLQRRIKNRVIN